MVPDFPPASCWQLRPLGHIEMRRNEQLTSISQVGSARVSLGMRSAGLQLGFNRSEPRPSTHSMALCSQGQRETVPTSAHPPDEKDPAVELAAKKGET